MEKGLDFSFTRPNLNSAKDLGYTFLISYISPNPSKNWRRTEIDQARKLGFKIGCVWESTAKRPLSGFDAGREDAIKALDMSRQLNYTGAIYFAVDFRPSTPKDIAATNDYFHGISTQIPREKIGVYGSYEVIEDVKEYAKYGWQVKTWAPKDASGQRKIHPNTAVVQDANVKSPIAGTDHNYLTKTDNGLEGATASNNEEMQPRKGVNVQAKYMGMIKIKTDSAGWGLGRIPHSEGRNPLFAVAIPNGNDPDKGEGYAQTCLTPPISFYDGNVIKIQILNGPKNGAIDMRVIAYFD